MPIILHNKYSKESNDFVNKYREGNTVIDWYGDRKARQGYLDAGTLHPSAFPSLVDSTHKVIVRKAKKPEDLTETIQEKINETKSTTDIYNSNH